MSEVAKLGPEQARLLTDQIKGHAEVMWHMFLKAYEGGAHKALGYSSWGDYFEKEFGGHHRHAYRMLDAGRVVRAIEDASDQLVTEVRPTESQARELAPLAKSDPKDAAGLWQEVTSRHGDKLTATDLRQAVKERVEFKDRLAALPEKTRAVLEQADENFDKHRNMLRNSNQMNHLENIAKKRGDEVAAEVAERTLTEEGASTFKVYEAYKAEAGIEEPRTMAETFAGLPPTEDEEPSPKFPERSEEEKRFNQISQWLAGLSRLKPEGVASYAKEPEEIERALRSARGVTEWFEAYAAALEDKTKRRLEVVK